MSQYLNLLEPPPSVEPITKAVAVLKSSTLSPVSLNLVMGYVMGFAFSLFGSMISAETATQSLGTADFFRHGFRSAHRLGANFALFGFLFCGLEVAIEKRRGRKDLWNQTCSGGVLGGAYGWRSAKAPGLAAGLAGGAAVSWAFEKLLAKMGWAEK